MGKIQIFGPANFKPHTHYWYCNIYSRTNGSRSVSSKKTFASNYQAAHTINIASFRCEPILRTVCYKAIYQSDQRISKVFYNTNISIIDYCTHHSLPLISRLPAAPHHHRAARLALPHNAMRARGLAPQTAVMCEGHELEWGMGKLWIRYYSDNLFRLERWEKLLPYKLNPRSSRSETYVHQIGQTSCFSLSKNKKESHFEAAPSTSLLNAAPAHREATAQVLNN